MTTPRLLQIVITKYADGAINLLGMGDGATHRQFHCVTEEFFFQSLQKLLDELEPVSRDL